jgi:hypothetical protein
MDTQSTPIENLNNSHDDTKVVNQILDKYNTLQSGGGELPPLNPSIPNMEKQFDNRNLNAEVFSHSSQNVAYQNDYNNEVQRTKQFQQQQQMQQQQPDEDDYEEDDYEEIEEEVVPLWRKVLNELRIPIFIMVMVCLFFNKKFEKFFVKSISFFGNQFNEVNGYGFTVLAFLVAFSSYLMIRFVRF